MTLGQYLNTTNSANSKKDDIIWNLWETDLTVPEKVQLSLQFNDQYPSSFNLMTMWLGYSASEEHSKELENKIYTYYLINLSDKTKDLSSSIEYSLYFDILEAPERNEYAWKFFLSKDPSDHFLKIILRNSGPLPYDLKHSLYIDLIPRIDLHADIYYSIRHSCFDNCGQVNKNPALDILNQLKLSDKMDEINSHPGFRKYDEVVKYLQN